MRSIMPTIIKEFEWKQTDTHIKIEISLKNVVAAKLNTFISARYIKVSYEHNFLDVILLCLIDVKDYKCIVRPESIILEFRKCEKRNWESLEPVLSKAEKQDLKRELLEKSYETIQNQTKQRYVLRAELKRTAIRKQIETDTKVRDTIEDAKEREKSVVLGDTKDWVKNVEMKLVKNYNKQSGDHCKQSLIKSETYSKLNIEPVTILPRQVKTLQVNFTPREFPTPCRESKLDEEKEWLTKQASARRSCGFVSDDIRPEERSPQFLKAKGDEFLKNKNYLGAISAYSFGIQISPTFFDFYISRAEAYFELGNYHRVINDCSSALELLKPECAANLNERSDCISMRGMALFKLGMEKEGQEELMYSLKLKPSQKIKEFFDNLK